MSICTINDTTLGLTEPILIDLLPPDNKWNINTASPVSTEFFVLKLHINTTQQQSLPWLTITNPPILKK